MKIIYDVTLIANIKGGMRSGIFFVADALLKEFIKRDDLELFLYCRAEDEMAAKAKLEPYLCGKNIPFIFDKSRFFSSKLRQSVKTFLNSLPKPMANFLYLILGFCIKTLQKIKDKKAQNSTLLENSPQSQYDIFFSPWFAVPASFAHLEKYIILYDAIPLIFEEYRKNPSNFWFLQLCDSLDESYNCFAISEYTKSDFLKQLPHLKPQNIIVTPLACDERFKPESAENIAAARKKYNIPENKKYIFSLCTLEPRKNLIRAVKCFATFIRKNNIDDLVFVLGGAHWDRFISILESEIENLNELKDKILKIGYVDDADQAALYSGALFFVYTSQYEGFGLPPLEAMSCGTPVITSNNSSLPEVVGDAGIMIDYDDDEAHIKAYESYYFNENLRAENSAKGLAQARKFSWEKCADIMINEFKARMRN